MKAIDFFKLVQSARDRADALATISDTARSFAGMAQAMRYDRAESGKISNGYRDPDGLLATVTSLDVTAMRALDAKEHYLQLVAEAEKLLLNILNDETVIDVAPMITLHQYYIEGLTQYAIGRRSHISQAAVHKRLDKGYEIAQPFLDRMLGA
jgi:hypothetical protein